MSTPVLTGINENFRRTAAGSTLGKLIFDPDKLSSIQPAQITSLLIAAGIPINSSTRIGVDSAQIIMSGGAVVEGIENSATIQALLSPATSVINATLDIMDSVGLLKKSSPAGYACNFGVALAMVVATGGTNVIADLGLIFTVLGQLFAPTKPVDIAAIESQLAAQAANQAKAWWVDTTTKEANAAASIFGQYHNGQVSIFEAIASVAQSAPELFLNYFPDYNTFVPPISLTHTESATKMVFDKNDDFANERDKLIYAMGAAFNWSASQWSNTSPESIKIQTYIKNTPSAQKYSFTGLSSFAPVFWNTYKTKLTYVTESASFNFDTIRQYAKPEFQDIFLRKFIQTPAQPYRFLNNITRSQLLQYGFPRSAKIDAHYNPVFPRIPISDIAILSMIPPYFTYMDDNFDFGNVLSTHNLTPRDLGDAFIEDEILKKLEPRDEPGITLNGVDYYTPIQAQANVGIDSNNALVKAAIAADQRGDMQTLNKISNVKSILKEWGTLPWLPPDIDAIMPRTDLNLGYRNIQNYWSTLSLMDSIRKDNYFLGCVTPLMKDLITFLPSREDIESRHKELSFISTTRKLNIQAKANIATFLNVSDYRKLKFEPMVTGQPVRLIKNKITVRS